MGMNGYEKNNLELNNVLVLSQEEPLPEPQAALSRRILGRASPCQKDFKRIEKDPLFRQLHGQPSAANVVNILRNGVARFDADKFKYSQQTQALPIFQRHVPNHPDTKKEQKLSGPTPDLAYGYPPRCSTTNSSTL